MAAPTFFMSSLMVHKGKTANHNPVYSHIVIHSDRDGTFTGKMIGDVTITELPTKFTFTVQDIKTFDNDRRLRVTFFVNNFTGIVAKLKAKLKSKFRPTGTETGQLTITVTGTTANVVVPVVYDDPPVDGG